jgi:hypothetical protein
MDMVEESETLRNLPRITTFEKKEEFSINYSLGTVTPGLPPARV